MDQISPINPAILRWARETAGFSVEEVVGKLNRKTITAETITSWENGISSPSYIQLENLAYRIYSRPLALFFFPDPPVEESPRQAFRTLPDSEIQRLSQRMRLLLRRAQAMQVNLDELYNGVNPSERQLVRDLHFSLSTPIQALADTVRIFLGIELAEQLQWKSSEEAFKAWRDILENHGVFVFKDAFKEDGISGFCLHDNRFPLIYVNNSTAPTRQIFTLFHELAHLLFGTGGIDTPDDQYIQVLRGQNKQIEIMCNRFAAAFLVPELDFERWIMNITINEMAINTLANRYSVSREVILRRLLDKKLIDPQFYEQTVKLWRDSGSGRKGTGGNYYFTKGNYLGERYMELAFSRHYQNKISVEQLADYLGVKTNNLPGMEALLFPRGVAV